MDKAPHLRIFTTLAGNLLVLSAVTAVFSPSHHQQPIIEIAVPLVAGILCLVATFQKELKNRAILLLIAGLSPVLSILWDMGDMEKYDQGTMALLGLQNIQPLIFWLLFGVGYAAVIIAAVLHRETLHPTLPRKIALGGGIALLVSLLMPRYAAGDLLGPIAFFPSLLFSNGDWVSGLSFVAMILAMMAAAGMSIAWGLGFKKETDYPNYILIAAFGAIGFIFLGLTAYTLTAGLLGHHSNGFSWIWALIAFLIAPTGFLIAQCLAGIAWLQLKYPASARATPITKLGPLRLTPPLAPVGAVMLTCPSCQQQTHSLKSYSNLDLLVFAGLFARWSRESHLECPRCMRLHLIDRAVANMLLSNLLWPFLILPGTIFQLVDSFTAGHSASIRNNIQQQLNTEANAQKAMQDRGRENRDL